MDLGLPFVPSGTEPKLEFYIGAKADNEAAAKDKVAALQADLENYNNEGSRALLHL